MMFRRKKWTLYCLLWLSLSLWSQERSQSFRVMFYNVENLFDTVDDPATNDDPFLPHGERAWSKRRYYRRLQQTAQVITAVGEWETPALVGLCEVENDTVMHHLLHRTPLATQGYRYCITEGNDQRGINVALLYQRDKFRYLGDESLRVRFSEKGKRSRDILHVWGEVITHDTLDIFVCHFPSRYGGERETMLYRMECAELLRMWCDSIACLRASAHLLVMGDFNDPPSSKSIQYLCEGGAAHRLTNLFADPSSLNFEGTLKYQGAWYLIDQIMVNERWMSYYVERSAQIFAPSFLLTDDKTHRGKRPFRTYYGFRYERGFSDHLPVVVDFSLPVDQLHLSDP